MDLVLVVLTAPSPQAGTRISPHILSDILWANAEPTDGLEHINIRPGAEPGSHVMGLFLLPDSASTTSAHADTDSDPVARALRVCHRAIEVAPALAGWAVAHHSLEHTRMKGIN